MNRSNPTSDPVPVDFGNRDEDGAVRLVSRGTTEHLRTHGVELVEGLRITMSDGELTAEGLCSRRQGMSIAVIERWVK